MTMWNKIIGKGKKRRALVFGVLVLSALALTACGGKKTEQKESLTVGFDQEFPPMGFVAEDGSYTGYDLELAEEVAKRLNLEFVPKPINWDGKDLELDSGNMTAFGTALV